MPKPSEHTINRVPSKLSLYSVRNAISQIGLTARQWNSLRAWIEREKLLDNDAAIYSYEPQCSWAEQVVTRIHERTEQYAPLIGVCERDLKNSPDPEYTIITRANVVQMIHKWFIAAGASIATSQEANRFLIALQILSWKAPRFLETKWPRTASLVRKLSTLAQSEDAIASPSKEYNCRSQSGLLPYSVRDALVSLNLIERQWEMLKAWIAQETLPDAGVDVESDESKRDWVLPVISRIQERLEHFVPLIEVCEGRLENPSGLIIGSTVVLIIQHWLVEAGASITTRRHADRFLLVLQTLSHEESSLFEVRWPRTFAFLCALRQAKLSSAERKDDRRVKVTRKKLLSTRLKEGINLSDREREVLICRINRGSTLKEAGESLKPQVSRERARQLQKSATKKINNGHGVIAPLLDALDKHASGLWDSIDSQASNEEVLKILTSKLIDSGFNDFDNDGIDLLLLFIRVLVCDGNTYIISKWPQITYTAACLKPQLKTHSKVALELECIAEAKRRWTYGELAETVLREAGEPLHWSQIVNRAETLGHRENFNPTSMFNALVDNDHFVRTDPGAYGLSTWDIETPETYVDIIADLLHRDGEAMTFGEIYQQVDAERPIKKSSLTLFLTLHPRFYESVESTFGLRAWLSPRHRQTLRTLRWKVETRDSFERVARSKEKGYKVEEIIAGDRKRAKAN